MRIYNVGNRVMNTYVYPIDNGYVMVDTGYDKSYKNVCKKLEKYNISFNEIKYIFLTHAHDDHAGFLNELLSKYPEIKVIVSNKAIKTLLKGQNSFNGGCSGILSLTFCNIMKLVGKGKHKFPPIEKQYLCRFIEIEKENKCELEEILGGKILFTPGHTSDSISLMLNNGVIFTGDANMNGFPSVKNVTIWIEDKEDFIKSWELLIAQNSQKIYPAHGKPFINKDLIKNMDYIKKVKLYELKGE